MITIEEYKKRYIDTQGKAPLILLNLQGESMYIPEVQSVTNSNGKLKMKWRAINVTDQWHPYTHVALINNDTVEYISEITPVNFDAKPHVLEIAF